MPKSEPIAPGEHQNVEDHPITKKGDKAVFSRGVAADEGRLSLKDWGDSFVNYNSAGRDTMAKAQGSLSEAISALVPRRKK